MLLTVASIAMTMGPISYGLITNRDNLMGFVIPSKATEILNELFREQPGATVVESYYNASMRTASIKINLTNPYKFALIINSVSADVECNADCFHLGLAVTGESKIIPAKTTESIIMNVTWTPEAVIHVSSVHPGSSSIIVDLTNLIVDVQGVSVKLPSKITLPEPIPFTQR